MKSGSREIQQRMKQQVPRKDEPMKTWIAKAAKFYGCTYLQAENLYYRPGRQIPNDIYIKLTSLSNPRLNPETNHPHLLDLKTKLEEQSKNISRLEQELAKQGQFKRKLGELLAQH